MLSEKKKTGLIWACIFFLPKSRCSLKKKKKKVFTSISSLISLFFSQNQGVLQKKKKRSSLRIVLWTNICSESKTVYAVFRGGAPKKMGGLRRLPHSPHPISTAVCKHVFTKKLSKIINLLNNKVITIKFSKTHWNRMAALNLWYMKEPVA